MGRFTAVASGAAFFLLAPCSSLLAAQTCPLAPSNDPVKAELPDLRHRYGWELSYRDDRVDHASKLSKFSRLRDTDVTLDDKWVFGLRFQLDYGWKR